MILVGQINTDKFYKNQKQNETTFLISPKMILNNKALPHNIKQIKCWDRV